MKENLKAYTTSITSVCLSLLIALTASHSGSLIQGSYPVIFKCVFITFVIQWAIFLPSYYWRTEKLYDLTGSLTYIIIIGIALSNKAGFIGQRSDIRSLIIGVFIIVWALRLGSFLFMRILKDKKDRRFNEWKQSFPLFLRTWSLQGMWIFFTSIAGLTAISSIRIIPPDAYLYLGSIFWIFGFLFESIADFQKRKFKIENKKTFINSGLWSISRHPNYFGEIILWIGISIIAFPVLNGWQLTSLVSPVFVYFLLTKVSGIPLLENHAEKTWGKNKSYKDYKANTPVLFPRFFK